MMNVNFLILVKDMNEKINNNNKKLIELLNTYSNYRFSLTYSAVETLNLNTLNTFGGDVVYSKSQRENSLIKQGFNQIDGNIFVVDLKEDQIIDYVKSMLKHISNNNAIYISDSDAEFKIKRATNSILRILYSHFSRILGFGKPIFAKNNFQYFSYDIVRDIKFSNKENNISRNFVSSIEFEYELLSLNKNPNNDMLDNIDNNNIGVIFAKMGIAFSVILFGILSIFYPQIQSINNGIYIHLMLFIFFVIVLYISLFMLSRNILKNIMNK